jgi:carbamate kinase
VKEAKNHLLQKQFPPGSMRPKIEAAISFVEKSKKTATITSVENIEAAVEGRAGTRIVPD